MAVDLATWVVGPATQLLDRLHSRSKSEQQALVAVASAGVVAALLAARYVYGSDPRKPYDDLCEHLKLTESLQGCMAILEWDELCKMPDGAADARGEQKEALAEVAHSMSVCSKRGRLIRAAKRSRTLRTLDAYEKSNVRDAERTYLREVRKPPALAKLEACLSSEGYHAWVKAREAKDGAGDFALFAPALTKLVKLRRDIAAHCAPRGTATYDFCIDQYERGVSSARIRQVLTEVKDGLVPLIKAVTSKPQLKTKYVLAGQFDVARQEQLSRTVAGALGFDWSVGRLDQSVHPFTGGPHPTDVRITTRFSDSDLLSALMGTVHETGHALYEQGRNPAHYGLPVSEALSMGIHESQSLLWERMVGQGLPFWTFLTPLIHDIFPQTKYVTAEDFYQWANKVQASLVRVDADELTYPLHIVIRFELEEALMQGKLQVADLPAAWNAKYKEYLGVEPTTDKEGVLQDIHWSDGSFGYFPTYTLGAMFAAQFYYQAAKELPTLSADLAAGKFTPLREWLRGKIHAVGSLHPSADELCVAVTGEPLNPSVFVNYLMI